MVKERLKSPYHKNYKQPHIRLVIKQLQFGWFTFKESVCSNNNDISCERDLPPETACSKL